MRMYYKHETDRVDQGCLREQYVVLKLLLWSFIWVARVGRLRRVGSVHIYVHHADVRRRDITHSVTLKDVSLRFAPDRQ